MGLYWSTADGGAGGGSIRTVRRQIQLLNFGQKPDLKGGKDMEYVTAFVVGGLICSVVQILLDRTKMMPGRVMVLLVCTGAVLGFCGIYKPFQEFAGAGASVPLLGFGNVLWQGIKEAVDRNGFIGIFMGGFEASAVGISAALIFGYIASFIFEPKMKK